MRNSGRLQTSLDPEIWSTVAFLKNLPDVKEDDFKKWVQQEDSGLILSWPPALPTRCG